MSNSVSIIDQDYKIWVSELSKRYRSSQVKASVKVNQEMLRFYWELGRDIVERDAENRYGSKFYANISSDLKQFIPSATGLSESSIRYTKRFYLLYNQQIKILQQVAEESADGKFQQLAEESAYGEQATLWMYQPLFSIPWGHHMLIIDKCSDNPNKAWFYVRQTVENGWSRNMLLNFMSTDLYERQGKALTNFKQMLPDTVSDLAQELTKDPYNFAFTGLREPYNERLLKDALLGNITRFLVELGTGFAYVGKEYRLQIGETENFIDLLFYNLTLSCYVVVEVKIGKLAFADVGQLNGYVVACNHQLRKPGRDNPTIGLLICKEKDATVAQYAVEGSTQPLGISEYELSKLYPQNVEGTIPSIKEIEAQLASSTTKSEDNA